MNQNTEISVIVFDDNRKGEVNFSPLTDMPDVICQLNYVSLDDKELLETVEETMGINVEPDIVLVDHVLDKTASTSQALITKGSSITPILRENWPNCAILGVTAERDDCLSETGRDAYDDVFDRQNINALARFLPNIAKGHEDARAIRSQSNLLNALKVPEKEWDVFPYALPDELRSPTDMGSPKFVHDLFRWFRHTLHAVPGFLYDKRWLALTLGIEEEYINNYLDKVSDCQYSGLWCDPADLRWWKADLYEFAWTMGKSVQESASEKIPVPDNHRSQCYKCQESWPEVMAFVDENPSSEEYPMHLRCSTSHPHRQSLPYFEERRIILEDE